MPNREGISSIQWILGTEKMILRSVKLMLHKKKYIGTLYLTKGGNELC